jgi:hypothetical protein
LLREQKGEAFLKALAISAEILKNKKQNDVDDDDDKDEKKQKKHRKDA